MNTHNPKGPPIGPLKRPFLTPQCLTQPRFREATARDTNSGFTAAEREHIRHCAWCSGVEAVLLAGPAPVSAEPPTAFTPLAPSRPDWIDDLLDSLADATGPTDYKIFDLVVLGGMTLDEVAAATNISVFAANTRVRTALATFEREIEAEPVARADYDDAYRSLS